MLFLQKVLGNSQTNQTKMSSANQQRELYAMTRSEATWLVNTYMDALKKGPEVGIEPYRIFRDALETMKPAYLGRFNNTANAAVQGYFYKIASNLRNILNELNKRVSDEDHYKKTLDAAKLLPCKHAIAYMTCTFLNWAVYNWYMKTSYPVAEDLGDNGYECNTCTVCAFSGESLFFFSTAYGLEKPVCEKCISYEDYNAPTAKEIKSDPDYEVSEEEESDEEDADEEKADEEKADEEKADEEKADEEKADEKDPDYVPSDDESDCDEEYDSGDEDLESNATEETDLSASETDASASESESDASESNSDESESDASDGDASESEKAFGCTGCPYEFRAGWKTGYKAAMKKIRAYADDHRRYAPDAPRCATCNDSHEGLKKCGRCQLVRYCSEDCQSEDWEEHKRVCRV